MNDEEIKAEPLISEMDKFSEIEDCYESFLTIRDAREQNIKEKILGWKNRLFRPMTNGSMRGSIFCLLCITFGSGILSLPYSIKLCGLVLTLIIFIISAYLVFTTLNLLCDCAFDNNTIDYLSLVNDIFGSKAMTLTTLVNLISNFGAIIVYQQIGRLRFKLVYNSILGLSQNWMRCIQMYLFCIFTQIPICLIREVVILHKFSIIGTLSLLYVVFVNNS